ncbi:ATP-dependent DNA ligase [Streptomyces sp. NPDC021093]|uniref:ATP-dependent DNA ligase n=1 Tax=Streptomyces sp. NPDC021093 TaxID=3365112 RepID=UPI0037AF69B6
METRQDGMRAIVYLPGDGRLVIRSRSGAPVTAVYPELHALADALAGMPAVLDGEIVALDEEGRPDFARLQSRMGASPAKAARLVATVPVHLVLFDALHLDDRSLLDRPFADRRRVLEDLGLHGAHWSTPAAVVGHVREAYELTREHQLEGIVDNCWRHRTNRGVRSKPWIKGKSMNGPPTWWSAGGCPAGEHCPGCPARSWSASPTGPADCGTRAASAPAVERERASLAHLLAVAEADDCPFTTLLDVPGARWVLPRLVGEIRYATRPRAGRLRHPSWYRLRPDLAPEDG